jgi:hypothetical protein
MWTDPTRAPWPRPWALLVLTMAGLAAPACRDRDFSLSAQASSGPRLAVKDIQLGREVDLSKHVTAPADRFHPADIVFTSVVTEGNVSSTLKARWLWRDRVVGESTQRIAPDGEAVSEFHAWKPDGWAKGPYEVQILVDDVPAGGRRFVVE